jgi:hypothetical protein
MSKEKTVVKIASAVEYYSDYVLWLEKAIAQLKAKDYNNVDWENLIEEIESLGKSQRRELRNRLITLLEHCLKLCYTNFDRDYRGWKETIRRSQRELKGLISDSPSLKPYWDEIFLECYAEALEILQENSDYQSFLFPDHCPFDRELDKILQATF